MTAIPARPKIYHITHGRNLSQIVSQGVWSDAQRIARKLDTKVVGMSAIKERRLKELTVNCHPGTKVGEFVPFFFCPRSIMLYILHLGNHPDVDYSGGQAPIIHLQADLHATVQWADENSVRWAFSKSNAGARYCDFFGSLERLVEVNWPAVQSTDFRSATVKEGKQAEFLLFDWFPWELVERIGVINRKRQEAVEKLLKTADHQPPVTIERGWYY
jgi:ssDNA thymidine ADP-ribosyltransferase DarT-like protein